MRDKLVNVKLGISSLQLKYAQLSEREKGLVGIFCGYLPISTITLYFLISFASYKLDAMDGVCGYNYTRTGDGATVLLHRPCK